MAPRNPQFSLYLPRAVLTWDLEGHRAVRRIEEATLLFADLSGFTALVERVAAQGREGAEVISEKINGVFERILAVVRDEGGDVLKFGGDASLVLFTGPDHAVSAALVALDMQDVLDELPEFGISIGAESGPVELVMVGDRFREFIVTGPTVQGTLRAEKDAETGQVIVGPGLARLLPQGAVEATGDGGGGELVADPDDLADLLGDEPAGAAPVLQGADHIDLGDYIPLGLRDSLTVAGSHSEHRYVATGFLHVTLDDQQPAPLDALTRLVDGIATSVERHGVAVLASDVELGGIKFLLCAGAPSSSHHEEERMLRALRAVLDECGELPARAGVTRGLVFAGDFGAAWRRYYTLLGDSVNLAARLMSTAEPGQLLTLDNVIDRSPTKFHVERLPPVLMKGKSKPVTPVAVGAIEGVERVDWARFLPVTGRSDELRIVNDALASARDGRGSALAIVGESGVGKTRLLGELLDRSSAVDSYLVVCERYEASTPYFAMAHLLRGVLGLKPDSDPDDVAERLADVGETWPELADWLPLLAVPLGIELPATSATESLADQFRPAKLNEVAVDLLARVRPSPTVIAIEDAQWIDDASRSFVEALSVATEERPWLVASTQLGDAGDRVLPGSERLDLSPLGEDDVRELLRIAAREMPASDETLEQIASTSGGHPFFALELLRHAEGDSLPESVEAVVTQRIDRLDVRDRQLLRFVSVLGNSFSLDLLAEALPEVAASAEDADTWNRLGDFLDVTVFGTVQFKQELIRAAAYDGLVYRRRHEIHATVAEAIERQSRRRAARQAPLLSQHFFLAQRWDKALHYSRIAAERAAAKGATGEAVALFERALDAARKQGGDASDSVIAEVCEALGDAAVLGGQPARAEEAYREAADLVDDASSSVTLTRKRGEVRRDQGDLDAARDLFARAIALVDELEGGGLDQDTGRAARAGVLVARAGLEHRAGEFEDAERLAADAMAMSDGGVAESAFATAALIRLANFQHLDREPDLDLAAMALGVFERLGDELGKAKVRNNEGFAAFYTSDWSAAVEAWNEAEVHYRAAGDAIGAATARNNLGEVLSDQGRLDAAESAFLDAQRAWKAASFPIGQALVLLNLGTVAARRGRRPEALELLADARARFAATGQVAYVAECDVRRVEVDAYLGRVAEVRGQVSALELGGESLTVQPVVRRLEALAFHEAGDDPAGLETAVIGALDAADAAGSSYQWALTARLFGEVIGRGDLTERAASTLAALGAEAAAGYQLATR